MVVTGCDTIIRRGSSIVPLLRAIQGSVIVYCWKASIDALDLVFGDVGFSPQLFNVHRARQHSRIAG